ncbi:putative membrane protein [Olavius sp. associated proteobacterium Delta 1]|nr:putative membrane protein [Olavius sp. associated proteobacterium Delta 1]
MNGIFIRWLTLTGAIILTSYLLDGIQVSGFVSAFFAAAMLGILNALFRPILILLTLPINILTLGFFTFVINALMLKTASGVITGFDVDGFWYAIFGSLIISAISWLLNSFINERGSVSYHRVDPATRYPKRRQPETRPQNENDTIDLENKGDDHWE